MTTKIKRVTDLSEVGAILAVRGDDIVAVDKSLLKGEKGDKGDRPSIHELVDFIGPQGVQGDQGVQGEIGLQGPKGDPSFVAGPVGPRGISGPDGATGPRGPQGPKGEPGPQGPRGSVGPIGTTGPQGQSGPTGKDGAPAELPVGAEDQVLTFKKGQWQANTPTDQTVGGIGYRTRFNRIEADIQAIGGIGAPLGGGSYVIDGGGSAIAVGNKRGWRCTVDGTIGEISIGTDLAATGQIDIWRSSNYPPVVGNSIFSSKPTLVNTVYQTDTVLSGVNSLVVNAGDWIFFNVDSMSAATWANVYIKLVRRTKLP